MKQKMLGFIAVVAFCAAFACSASAQQAQFTVGDGGTELKLIKSGRATLVAGVAVIPETAVAATDDIFVFRQADAGTPGVTLKITARSAGTSFTVTSKAADGAATATSDTSVISYLLLRR